ncbi:MAG: hypothetical protein ACM3ME_02340 [Chloroflexota bacterium]
MNTQYKLFTVLTLVWILSSCASQQKPDNKFDVSVKTPTFTEHHPMILFDEAHHNMHTSTGTYSPFVNLITNDGCIVKPNSTPFSKTSLAGYDILVISNAKGGKHNFKHKPAFTDLECSIVKQWVMQGGSLLLIADHYPMGSAAENLAQQFGVHMFNGETMDSIYFEGNSSFRDKLVFSRENKLLLDNEITRGRKPSEMLTKIVSDRGQSLSVPDSAMVILKLSPSSYHSLPDSIWDIGTTTYTRFTGPISAFGNCQGLALKVGKGRVVILGEAAMITAQLFKGEKFGMNTPGNDNKQFALNIIHWLADN